MILFYVPCRDSDEARKIAKHLLDKKLVACANLLPIDSLYHWEGEVKEDQEVVLLLKTLKKNINHVELEVKDLHSYEVPCLIQLEVKANKEYLDWMEGVLR